MPVIALNFVGVKASRTQNPVKGEIKVNSTPKINQVKEVKLPNLGKEALSLEWEFVTEYAPDHGEIRLEGNILFVTDDIQEIVKKWKKEKTLPEDVSVPVLNHLFRKCLIKIAGLADELQLPPPMQLPLVKAKE